MSRVLLFNPWLSVATLAWVLAQVLKMAIHTIATRRVDFSRLVDTGGMPSSHTAFVAALATCVGITEGWHSPLFAIVLCFSMIIVYDATNLRRSAGYHAQVLNEIVPNLLRGHVLKEVVSYRQLRELLGHSPAEVIVGAVLGILITTWFVMYFSIAYSP
jgi:acid phosphatase family membrane protein YuiD